MKTKSGRNIASIIWKYAQKGRLTEEEAADLAAFRSLSKEHNELPDQLLTPRFLINEIREDYEWRLLQPAAWEELVRRLGGNRDGGSGGAGEQEGVKS